MFRTVIADPAWSYDDKKADMKACGPGAESHYRCLPIDKIMSFLDDTPLPGTQLPISECIDDDAHLWMWVTNGFLADGVAAEVVKRWGFRSVTVATWVKGRVTIVKIRPEEAAGNPEAIQIGAQWYAPKLIQRIGQGRYLRNSTEHVIFATRGRCPVPDGCRNLPTSFVAPRGAHSRKPDTIHEWAERLSPSPPLELFARRGRPGWTSVGDELPVEGEPLEAVVLGAFEAE